MNFLSNHKKLTASLVLLAVLSLAACGQRNQDAIDNTPTDQTPATTNTPEANTTATSAGVPPTGNDCPSNAPVKGVDTAKRGKIYHTTSYPDYKQVKATTCFKDAVSAEQAGYKLPQAQ